jgi:hypothetical protein
VFVTTADILKILKYIPNIGSKRAQVTNTRKSVFENNEIPLDK